METWFEEDSTESMEKVSTTAKWRFSVVQNSHVSAAAMAATGCVSVVAEVRKRVSVAAAVKEQVSATLQKRMSVAFQKWISVPLQKQAVTKQDAKALSSSGVSAAAKTENVVLLERAIGDLLSTYKGKCYVPKIPT